MDTIIKEENRVWGEGTEIVKTTDEDIIQERRISGMSSRWLFKSLTLIAREKLRPKSKYFKCIIAAEGLVEYDGPTLLKLISIRMNLSSNVKISNLLDKLRNFNTGMYRNKIPDMLDDMDKVHDEILSEKYIYYHYIKFNGYNANF